MNTENYLQSFIQPVLYILNKAGEALDTHKISKILYFADRDHLAKYGTLISNDTYMKMKFGPVPSTIYDIIKALQGKGGLVSKSDVDAFLELTWDDKISPKVCFDQDEFSKSEMECLNSSVEEYSDKSFGYLTDISHDYAWNEATYTMDNLKIAKAGGADEKMIEYIKHYNKLSSSNFL